MNYLLFFNPALVLGVFTSIGLILFRKRSIAVKVIFFNLTVIFIMAGIFDLFFTVYFSPKYTRFRTNSSYYHHGLKPNMTERTKWFNEYTIYTNSLGFLDEKIRDVPLKKSGKRFVFIGDSFTEGVSEPWANTFPGIVSKELKKENIELLNAGCISYSPKIYYLKMKYFIEKGLEMDDLFVFIDISDVQDEIEYAYFKPTEPLFLLSDVNLFFYQTSYMYRYVYDRFFYWQENPRHKDSPFWEGQFYPVRHLWSMDEYHYNKWGREGLELSKKHMDQLFELTKKHGIKLHISVYPWRMHILRHDLDSIQVQFWKKFCEERNIDFINFFPGFINVENVEEMEQKWFVPGDVHWSREGLKKMGDLVIDYFKKEKILK
ncbi:MAG TPA: hypothetical protein PKG52_09410 [bacterium]|nr:hypothetical protein [bacterium]HPS30717.1 hypothetical protein [bacterium]